MQNQLSASSLLLGRVSQPQLQAPGPNNNQLDFILKAAMAVPDHGAIQPWQFTVVQGEGLQRLSDIFASTIDANEDNQAKLEKVKRMPFRAPCIIVVSTRYQHHEKVPHQEQLVAAGCATHAMQMAAYTQGLGAMWRTGDMAYNDMIKDGLEIDKSDDIVGFLYIGTPAKTIPQKSRKPYQPLVSYL